MTFNHRIGLLYIWYFRAKMSTQLFFNSPDALASISQKIKIINHEMLGISTGLEYVVPSVKSFLWNRVHQSSGKVFPF